MIIDALPEWNPFGKASITLPAANRGPLPYDLLRARGEETKAEAFSDCVADHRSITEDSADRRRRTLVCIDGKDGAAI